MLRNVRILIAFLIFPIGPSAFAAGPRPADGLLRLVPKDAGAVLIFEDLRSRSRAALASPLAEGLGRLPAVRAWRDSESGQTYFNAMEDVEGALGIDLAAIRDEVLGDAAVLVIRPGMAGPADDSRGLILIRPRDRALVQRLVATINKGDQESGTLIELADRRRGATSYQVRRFQPGSKPDEAIAMFDDGVFAWTNSEEMLRDVIDHRSVGPGGLGEDPDFQAVRAALPATALATLIVNPRIFAAARVEANPPRDPVEGLLRRFVAAINHVGVALEWRDDGLILHAFEQLDPSRLDAPLSRLLQTAALGDDLLGRVPGTALAVAACRIDVGALVDELTTFVPEAERIKLENLKVALGGIFLGRDLGKEILPRIGPGVVAYLGSLDGPDLAMAAELEPNSEVGAALDNGLKTLLALTAADAKHAGEGRKLEVRELDGVRVTGLSGPDWPVHYAVAAGRLVIGRTPASVAALIQAGTAGGRFAEFRARYFPGVANVLFADIEALQKQAETHRDAIARHLAAGRGAEAESAGRDLDQVLGLARLFRGAFATFEVQAGSRSVQQRLGLIAREKLGR
jgi:hypothetical protein